MARTLTSGIQAALQSEVVRPVTMYRMALDSGVVAVHSGVGTIAFNGDNYLGVGNLGAISTIEETMSIAPSGIKATLTAIPSEYVSLVLGEHYQGRTAQVYIGLLDENYELIVDPALAFQGRCDFADMEIGEKAMISLSVESRLADWERARVKRFTDEEQKRQYPTDQGLEFVASMVEKELVWGV